MMLLINENVLESIKLSRTFSFHIVCSIVYSTVTKIGVWSER